MRTRKRTDAPLRAARASLIVLLVPVLHGLPAHAAEPAGAEGLRYFREKIEPVLVSECYQCHSSRAEKVKGGLRLDSRAAMLQGGDTGPAVVPGEVDESLLVLAIRHEDGLEMPPKKPKLPDAAIADFATWVEMGAPAPAGEEASAAAKSGVGRGAPALGVPAGARVAPPKVEDAAWVKSPVDAFVLAKLEGRRMEARARGRPGRMDPPGHVRPDRPAADARGGRRVRGRHVARRLRAAGRSAAGAARATASAGRQHWLDVVRYAETDGFEYDRTVPDAWRYRDYVIDSLQRATSRSTGS